MKAEFGAAQVCDLGSLLLRKLLWRYKRIHDLRECKIKALKPNRKVELLRTQYLVAQEKCSRGRV